MRTVNTRLFVVNNRTRPELNTTNNKCLYIIVVFVVIVLMLLIAVIYFAITFPLIEHKDNKDFILEKRVNNRFYIGKTSKPKSLIYDDTYDNLDDNNNNIYNKTKSILIRIMHRSIINLSATPFLVGLGAEKSGSTSLGAAMFHSGEFTCPDSDEIDVETKYWSECFKWDIWDYNNNNNNNFNFIAKLENKIGGHCSIKQYQTWQRWRNGKYKFEKSVDYLGLPYVTRIFSDIFVQKYGTKIFVMIRYPPPRISSTWKFFVGNEKDNMPNEYGNVEQFTKHLLKNNILIDLIDLLNTPNIKLFGLDWRHIILPKWNEYMLSLVSQCRQEAPIAGFKSEYCNPSQLLRRAVGLSCYIVPLMQWIIDLGIENAINYFRIIQSELYFKNGKDIMDRLICWSKQGTIATNKCNVNKLYKSGSIKIKKLQGTKKSQTNDFSDELINRLHSIFMPCNSRLFELLKLYPQLALKEFDWNDWHFDPKLMNQNI